MDTTSKAFVSLAAGALLLLAGAAWAQQKPTPEEPGCVIKPVMSDEDLRRCGATPTQPKI